MINQEILDHVRSLFIESLEESLKIYTHDGNEEWVNEQKCRELIAQVRSKTPGEIGGPFWGDHLDAVLNKEGIRGYGGDKERYSSYWKAIEEGR